MENSTKDLKLLVLHGLSDRFSTTFSRPTRLVTWNKCTLPKMFLHVGVDREGVGP